MNKEDLEFIESKINSARMRIYSVSSILFEIANGNFDELHPEDIDFVKDNTHGEIKDFYHLIIVYLEMRGLNNYLLKFISKYEYILLDRDKAIKIDSIPIGDGDYYEDMTLLVEWSAFLRPFKFYNATKTTEYKKLIGLLECTNEILKITNVKPEREDDINRIMREITGLYYEGVIAFSEGYFRHQFKSYKPDIIIKEIGTAVEYKLIRTQEDVGIKIDELISDSKRYTDNFNNQYCIAVFCLCKSITTIKKRIREDWEKMNFPPNWELVIISDIELKEKKNLKKP